MLFLDGLYRSHEGEFTDANLRFYQDGRVVAATTYRASPEEVARWLAYDSVDPSLSQGTYTIKGQRITFITISSYGAVEYKGTIELDGAVLKLASHSHINGYRGRAIYTYTPVLFAC